MNVLRYRGHRGHVSTEDDRILIEVVDLLDVHLTATCGSISGAQAAFEELVDTYYKVCELSRNLLI